ncbi:hypothetical protein [uncultured Bacteroides sp.]|uniref:fimbrillin family protein n=1 Tax=uncultured Bacteroides sp. TaxID=162156 RepID=UPI00262D1EAF|nr:hypothetical protein [uncultured Bacteroides sp.]
MKKFGFFLGGLSVVLSFLTACSEVDEITNDSDNNVSIIGSHDGYGSFMNSRSQVGGATENGALFMEWTVGDMIGVFSDKSVNNPFKSNNTIPEANTTFSGEMESGDIPRFAYYPYNANATNMEAIPVLVPTDQVYANENSIASYDIKAADVIVNNGSGKYKLNMRQMVSLIRFEINLTDVQGFGVDEKLVRVELETGAPVSGEYTYSLSNLDGGLTPVSGKQSNSLNITFSAQPSLESMVVAYAVAVPGNQYNKEWNCKFITNKHQVVFKTRALANFNAGSYYTIPLNATVIKNNDAVVEDIPEPEETANCYMINTTGEHSFLATVIGNGQKGIIPGAGFHTETAYISPKSAKLLWQDVNGFIDPLSVELRSDGRCYYRADRNTGNAVIAVYSGENQTGEIIWSWHIWGVGDEMPSDDVYTNKIGDQFTVMDRTLGALSKTSEYVTLYQWGRKDPFPNSSVYYVDGEAKEIETSFPVYVSQTGTIAETVQHPAELQKYIDNFHGNWMAETNNYLWGDTNESKNVYPDYLNAATACAGWTDVKTIYDPSPVGYRVANKFTWTGFVKRSDGDTSGVSGTTSRLDYINYVKYENGFYFKRNDSDTEGVFYPQTGCRFGSNGTMWSAGQNSVLMRGGTAKYWSASPHNAGSTSEPYSAYMMIGSYTDINSSTPWGSENKVKVYDYTSSRRDACAIRCVRE